jgi:hypothetical protein
VPLISSHDEAEEGRKSTVEKAERRDGWRAGLDVDLRGNFIDVLRLAG